MVLPLRDPLVATFNETRAPTSTRYVTEQGIVMPNWWKTIQTFLSQWSVFALEKQSINLNTMFLPLTNPLLATFKETHAPTSDKDVAEQFIMMPNSSNTFQTFWSHNYVFDSEKETKNLNFQCFYLYETLWGLLLMKRMQLLLENI